MLGLRYSASRHGADVNRTNVIDDDDDLYSGFNDVAPALDTRTLREDQTFHEVVRTAGIGRQMPSRMGTGIIGLGTGKIRGASRAGTAARPMTALRAAGYTSTVRDTQLKDDRKEDSIEDRIKQMELRIMIFVEESCIFSARQDADDDMLPKKEYDLGQALSKAQEASALERQLIRMQEQANMGDSHNLDLTFAVLCNLAGQYALNEMYTEALNTYQLLTRNKLFPHANRLKVNMGNIYFKMGEHPKALKLYRMALDQTPTAEKDLRMKVMHNIGLLLVRMGKFRDAVTNFQHIMHEQGDFQTGLHLVLCAVALNDAEAGKAAFHAMLDVEPVTCHQDIPIDDENDAYECVLRDVVRADRLSQWSRHSAEHAERCLALAAAALAGPNARDDDAGTSWCAEALRGYSGGSAGARLELGGALAALRSAVAPASCGGSALMAGTRVLQRLKAVARAHHEDRVLRAEAASDAAFVAYALGKWTEAKTLSESASRDDPYSCAARVCGALADLSAARLPDSPDILPDVAGEVSRRLVAASHLDPTDLVAMHDLALCMELSGEAAGAEARWQRVRGASGAGGTLRALAAAGLARIAHSGAADPSAADHWYSMIGSWDAGVTCALAQLHNEMGDSQTAKHHYQDVEAVWPCELSALQWLASDARPEEALRYYRRAARLQPSNPQWGLLIGGCLRSIGRYQEALSLYKKLNTRFPDNVQCLKLIVKLCGDQGLSETTAWTRELQRAQARLKQQERVVAVASAESGSSGASRSPIDLIRAQFVRSIRSDRHYMSGRYAYSITTEHPMKRNTTLQGNVLIEFAAGSRAERTTMSRQSSDGRGDSATAGTTEVYIQDSFQRANRSMNNSVRKKKAEVLDDDLPLPPE